MSLILYKLIIIVFAHLIGDYFLQTEYLAINKGKDKYILFVHSMLYLFGIIVVFGIFGMSIDLLSGIVIVISHLFIDNYKATGKMAKMLSKTKFSDIFVDQFLHYLILILLVIIN